MNKTSTILDSKGKPYSLGVYSASKNSASNKFYNGWNSRPMPESEMLPMDNRVRMIAYLRTAIRNNPVIAAICRQYANTISFPQMRALGSDPLYNNVKERLLEDVLKRIGSGSNLSLQKLAYVINIEELLAGECFAVFLEDGKIQLIESELCGSPKECPSNELDGIKYDGNGTPTKYRFAHG